MFNLKIKFSLSQLELLKAEVRRAYPDIKSSHRCEAIARGLGYNTYAAALTSSRIDKITTVEVSGSNFIKYLMDHGFYCSSKFFYESTAKIAIHDAAERVPRLTVWGYGIGSPRRKSDGSWETSREQYTNFVKEREDLLKGNYADAFLASLAFLKMVTRTKTIRPGTGSYWLKHIAENFACAYPDGEALGPTYIPNGIFIAAAIHCNFIYKTHLDDLGYDHPNVTFNMSKPRLLDLDSQIRPNSGRRP